jgi:hypothetical protein
VRFVVNGVAQGLVFSKYFGFALSVSFHQCTILLKGQKGEAWEASNKAMLFAISVEQGM